jgi:hypothetical protein
MIRIKVAQNLFPHLISNHLPSRMAIPYNLAQLLNCDLSRPILVKCLERLPQSLFLLVDVLVKRGRQEL